MLTSALFVIVALLAAGEFLLFGALAEAYRDIRQLRERAGMIDRAVPVDLGTALGKPPSSLGMHPDLDSAVRAVVVYLEQHCGTCRSIVSSLNGGIPKGIWLAVVSESPEEAFAWLREAGISPGTTSGDRVMAASAAQIEYHYGVRVTPLAIEIENGLVARARAISSVRQFYAMVPTTLAVAQPLEQGASV